MSVHWEGVGDGLVTNRMQSFCNSHPLVKTQKWGWEGAFTTKQSVAKPFRGLWDAQVSKMPRAPVLLIHFESLTVLLQILSCQTE